MNIEFFDGEVILGAISLVVLGFVAVRTYKITEHKKDFEIANQIRKQLRDLIEVESSIATEIRVSCENITDKLLLERVKGLRETPKLLTIIESLDTSNDKETLEFSKNARLIHDKYIEISNLYIYSLSDLIIEHEKVLGVYERTLIYKKIMSFNIENEEFYYNVQRFYDYLKEKGDYDNQVRLAFSLIESEICRGLLYRAEERLKEINNKLFMEKVDLHDLHVKYWLGKLEKELESKQR